VSQDGITREAVSVEDRQDVTYADIAVITEFVDAANRDLERYRFDRHFVASVAPSKCRHDATLLQQDREIHGWK
jgi:hypothetical protein